MVLMCVGRGEHITHHQPTMAKIYTFHQPSSQSSVWAAISWASNRIKNAHSKQCNNHRWRLFHSYFSVAQQLECFLNTVFLHIHPAKSPLEALNAGLGNHLSITLKSMNQTCWLGICVGARFDTSCPLQPHGLQLCTTTVF